MNAINSPVVSAYEMAVKFNPTHSRTNELANARNTSSANGGDTYARHGVATLRAFVARNKSLMAV